jgi:hypothetical protein
MNGGPLKGTREYTSTSSNFFEIQSPPGFGVKAGGYLTHGCATACLSDDILHMAAFMWFV